MGVRKLIKKYKDYETKELARRAEKKRKVAPYKSLANKRIPVKKAEKLKLSYKGITKAIDNPYGVKFPKAKKIIKRAKKRAKKRKMSKTVTIVYK